MDAPWLELYNFLAKAPKGELLEFAKSGLDYNPKKWENDLTKYNCLNYILDSKKEKEMWLETNYVSLLFEWNKSQTNKPIEELCVDVQRKVEKNFIFMRYAPFDKVTQIIRQEIPAIINQLDATPIYKPEDLQEDHYLAAYGLTKHYAGGHFSRLDNDGMWSEKPGQRAVRKHDISNPYAKQACSSFIPIFFFSLKAEL